MEIRLDGRAIRKADEFAGFIVYEGPSLLTRDPIVAIITGLDGTSENGKTGPMAQAWIIRSDIDPVAAVKSGADRAICGDCQHRSGTNIGRSCYVIWWLAPQNIYRAYKAGQYRRLTPEAQERAMLGNYLRIGAYGDPAAIPYRSWLPAVRGCSGAIGYTQRWRDCDPMFARLLMASVQSPFEKQLAIAKGWRTFRTRPEGGKVLDDETICPASHEGRHSSTCEECQLCQGITKRAKNVVIVAHGQRVKWFSERPAP